MPGLVILAVAAIGAPLVIRLLLELEEHLAKKLEKEEAKHLAATR
jgi:hypothetical protein